MPENAIEKWELTFRADAKVDGYALLRDHLRRLDLPDSPELLLDGTIEVMQASLSYCTIDGRESAFNKFLQMQSYYPTKTADPAYALTFDIWGTVFGRIITPPDIKFVDLADLYDHPWYEYESAGYNRLFISRTDWAELNREEVAMLEAEVTADLRHDYGKDEMHFWFEDSPCQTQLIVHLYDGPKPID